ncbi:MAG: DEAD/DEAH box helicase family protein [Prevotella sp.]|nr:DEAD/DEAH box helicase family protein [Prevotella sp.]
MLKTNVLWPESRRFKSHTEWEPVGFFSEGLCNATLFDLKLGFFSSSAINVLCDGFSCFLYNGGRMRLIINDILSEPDKKAIDKAKSKSFLPSFNLSDIENLKETLSERDRHFYDCISWLIRYERIDIKIVTPNDGIGIAHTKCGLFSDGLNTVAFDGSCNFSRSALLENNESITAFCDWDGGKDIYKINDIKEDFELTFNGNDPTVKYIDAHDIRTHISSAFPVKEMKELLEDEKNLLEQKDDKKLSDPIRAILIKAKNKVQETIEKIAAKSIGQSNVIIPEFPYPSGPRDYQKKAFENWKPTQKGMFVMATGTGKTLTSLNCLLEIYNRKHYYKAIILVPTFTLVEQWEQECKKFNFEHIYKVYSKSKNCKNELESLLLKEDFNPSGEAVSYIIIATYASFVRTGIFETLIRFPRKQTLLIADEVHNMGSKRILDKIDGIKYVRRIGLSATPNRQFDDEANSRLREFFGVKDEYTFEYSMKDAIENGFLCRYYYYPHVVNLTATEMSEYLQLSTKLAKFYNVSKKSFPSGDDILMALLLKRKRIIHKAKNKETVFKSIIEERFKEKGNLKYTLVYVPEGNRPDETGDIFDERDIIPDDETSEHLIDLYTKIVCNVSPVTTVKKFVSDSKDRNQILNDFANGELEVLTSMKCLDEGVDVPRSEMAIFCASTGNPRQFIQRRGRILRTHKDKYHAVIHDLIVAPLISSSSDSYTMERNLIENELKRVRDFALLSENPDRTYTELEDITSKYNLSI